MRKYRYIWLPLILLAYGMLMAACFGKELCDAGRAWQLWLFVITDIAVCIALSIFLKKRSQF